MDKEFIPYEQALELDELGFDEACLTYYNGRGNTEMYYNTFLDGSGNYRPFVKHERLTWFGSPLYQQSFRWFREKYGLYTEMFVDDNKTFGYLISSFTGEDRLDKSIKRGFTTYDEAELNCLKELIQIVKNK